MKRTILRVMIALMIWTPYQFAMAGMIGTEQVVAPVSQTDRVTVLNFLSRADVTRQLQVFGIDPAQARDRVNAMTDQEIAALAQPIDSLPAGGRSRAAADIIVIILIAAAFWWAYGRR